MNLFIVRTSKIGKRLYSISNIPELTGIANEVSGQSCCHIKLYRSGNLSIEAYQKSFIHYILSLLPIVGQFFLAPFDIYKHNKKIGSSIKLESLKQYEFVVNNISYILMCHSINYVSLWRNDLQVALFSTNGDGKYKIKYNDFGTDTIELLFLFCIAIDELECDSPYQIYSNTYVFRDPKGKEAINWQPDNKEESGF